MDLDKFHLLIKSYLNFKICVTFYYSIYVEAKVSARYGIEDYVFMCIHLAFLSRSHANAHS